MSESDEPPAVALAFVFLLFWALASAVTAGASALGVGAGYFDVLGLMLWTSLSLLAYHHRKKLLEGARERIAKAGQPVEPDEVIDDVVDDGEGSP
jgi:hypothetical protein